MASERNHLWLARFFATLPVRSTDYYAKFDAGRRIINCNECMARPDATIAQSACYQFLALRAANNTAGCGPQTSDPN